MVTSIFKARVPFHLWEPILEACGGDPALVAVLLQKCFEVACLNVAYPPMPGRRFQPSRVLPPDPASGVQVDESSDPWELAAIAAAESIDLVKPGVLVLRLNASENFSDKSDDADVLDPWRGAVL